MNKFFSRTRLLVLLLCLLLTACDAAPVTVAPVSTATPTPAIPTPAPVAEPTATPAAEESQAAETEATTAQTATFVIVPEETEARYAIDEIFINDNNKLNTAVGVTNAVEGQFTLDYTDPTQSAFGQFVVDISTLTSNQSRRDRAIRTRWLESSTYPLATFDVKEVRNFPADPQEGMPINFQLVGDMTVKENTREVVWEATATLQGDRLTGTATLATTLEFFDIPIPSIIGILSVTDGITLTLDFTFVKLP